MTKSIGMNCLWKWYRKAVKRCNQLAKSVDFWRDEYLCLEDENRHLKNENDRLITIYYNLYCNHELLEKQYEKVIDRNYEPSFVSTSAKNTKSISSAFNRAYGVANQ